MKTGILSAMEEEFTLLLSEVKNQKRTSLGKREYIEGTLWGHEVVLVFSQWGKTAAASTTANLINVFHIDRLVFTGVAGGLDANAKIGDIVIAERLFHHDVDASPFKKRYYVPLIGENGVKADKKTSDDLEKAAETFVKNIHQYISDEDLKEFSLTNVKVHRKNIATGDFFVKTEEVRNRIMTDLPDMYAVEMEGAAVAQVCWEHSLPFAIMRTISDTANEHSPMDYPKFLHRVASIYSLLVMKNFLNE